VRVVVIGGGAIGLCCAYSLHRDGASVTVVERGRCGDGATRGNTGWLCPVLSAPLPAPGVMRTALEGMLRPSRSPVKIRPIFGPSFLRWSWGFWRASTAARCRRGLADTLALGMPCFELYDELRASGVELELHRSGMIVAATTEVGLGEYAAMLGEARDAGYPYPIERLSAARARELEPALGDAVVGALHVPEERFVRPESLTRGLVAYLRAGGAEVREGEEVLSLGRAGGGWRVRAGGGELEADAVVVAAGVWSTRLLAGLGVRVPMEAAKGYSITATGEGTLPRHALYLAEGKVGTSTYDGDVLRIAGIFDLTGIDTSLRRKRIDEMVRASLPYLRDWRPVDVELEWSGLRPYPADGLPIVGPVPGRPGLVVATGHGRMGITLAPSTGDAVSRLVLEGAVAPEIVPFGVERFL
jgi:D-amino-acid dehydrogenase